MTTISNQVRYYHSDMPGAPVLSGTAGTLIHVLDACLVDGWDVRAINTLTVANGIATAQISAGHFYGEGDVIRVAGATPAALNGDWRLASVTGSTAVWSVDGLGIPDGSATGTITAMRAPAGWEKVFAATNKAVYRSLRHAEHNGLLLYVDDSTGTAAQAYGYESMTSIDTGTARFPAAAQSAENWWGKSSVLDATSRSWVVVADAKRFTYCPRPNSSYPKGRPFCFGLLLHAQGVDPWATFINGAASAANAIAYNISLVEIGDLAYAANSTSANAGALARGRVSGQPAPSRSGAASPYSWNTGASGFYLSVLSTTHPVVSPILISDDTYQARGYFPAVAYSTYRYEHATSPRGTLSGVPGNGLRLEYSSSGSSSPWFLHLGTNGRWD